MGNNDYIDLTIRLNADDISDILFVIGSTEGEISSPNNCDRMVKFSSSLVMNVVRTYLTQKIKAMVDQNKPSTNLFPPYRDSDS